MPASDADGFEAVARQRSYGPAVEQTQKEGGSEEEVRTAWRRGWLKQCSMVGKHAQLAACLLLARHVRWLCPMRVQWCAPLCISQVVWLAPRTAPAAQVWMQVEKALMGKTTMLSPRHLLDAGEEGPWVSIGGRAHCLPKHCRPSTSAAGLSQAASPAVPA